MRGGHTEQWRPSDGQPPDGGGDVLDGERLHRDLLRRKTGLVQHPKRIAGPFDRLHPPTPSALACLAIATTDSAASASVPANAYTPCSPGPPASSGTVPG